ncbi:MAG: hypothetical protein ACR2IA_03405 [Pyrinomonadaceae bacterium]
METKTFTIPPKLSLKSFPKHLRKYFYYEIKSPVNFSILIFNLAFGLVRDELSLYVFSYFFYFSAKIIINLGGVVVFYKYGVIDRLLENEINPTLKKIVYKTIWNIFYYPNQPKIKKPHTSTLLKTVKFLFSFKTQKEVFEPIVADWQEEYFEALFKKEIWKSRWINVRYTYAFIIAMWQKSPIGDLIEFISKIAK